MSSSLMYSTPPLGPFSLLFWGNSEGGSLNTIGILYLILSLMIFYLSNMAFENKLNLIFIKNIFGEKIHSLVIKYSTYINKSNNIWLMIIFILIFCCSLASLYFSYFILNNIDIISEIVQQSKPK